MATVRPGFHLMGMMVCAAALVACGPSPRPPGDPDGGLADGAVDDDAAIFEDVTDASGIAFQIPKPADPRTGAAEIGGGVCVLDADGVPPLDIFFAVPVSTSASRLYRAEAPWTYADATEEAGLAGIHAGGCLAFDADGDGDDDLLLSGAGSVTFYEQSAHRFIARPEWIAEGTVLSDAAYAGTTAADFDGDGDLDVVAAAWGYNDATAYIPMEEPQRQFLPSLLLMRDADGVFHDRAQTLAPDVAKKLPLLVVSALDINDDGAMDLYLGNDFGTYYKDQVLVQQDGHFADQSATYGLAYNAQGDGLDTMGIAMADVDRNGTVDYAVSGNEKQSSALFLCGIDGPFCDDYGPSWGTDVTINHVRWGNALVDMDLDGWPDLMESRGSILTREELERLIPDEVMFDVEALLRLRTPYFHRNDRGQRFVRTRAVPASAARMGRGLAVADLDDDGRPDVVEMVAVGEPLLLRNKAPRRGHWLRVSLRGTAANTGAIGAKVVVTTPDGPLTQYRVISQGYLGNFDPRLLFGLGGATRVRVDVRWPDGQTTSRANVKVDQELVLTQP